MAAKPVTFAEKSRARIAATVRDYEQRQLRAEGGNKGGRPSEFVCFEAIVTNEGPDGEADFEDNRYWVERAGLSTNDAAVDAAAEFEAFEPGHDLAAILCATNLAEQVSAAHLVAPGTPVTVFYAFDQSSDSQPRYWFTCRGGAGLDVFLQQDGGTGGSGAGAASWTYTITAIGSTSPLATEVPVQRWYPLQASAAPNGSVGRAVWVNGAYMLIVVPETPVFGSPCDEGE